MKRSTLKRMRLDPTQYIVANCAVYTTIKLDEHDDLAAEQNITTFRMLDTGEVFKNHLAFPCCTVTPPFREEFPDTAEFIGPAPEAPKHGEKFPKSANRIRRELRCKGNHAMNMTDFYRGWKQRVQGNIRKFGFRDPHLIGDLEQTIYLRMIKFRTIEDCKCALTGAAAFSTHAFSVVRTVCLNYLRDNGKHKDCIKCEKHRDCIHGYCMHCKDCTHTEQRPDCRVCSRCADPSQYVVCKECGEVKVCEACKRCAPCKNRVARPARNILSQAEPLFMNGEEGEEFLHPEVVKLCGDGDVTGSPVDRFLELLYAELEGRKWQSGDQHTIKSLTKVCAMLHVGHSPSEIARHYNVSPGAVTIWKKKIRMIGDEIRAKTGMQLDDGLCDPIVEFPDGVTREIIRAKAQRILDQCSLPDDVTMESIRRTAAKIKKATDQKGESDDRN